MFVINGNLWNFREAGVGRDQDLGQGQGQEVDQLPGKNMYFSLECIVHWCLTLSLVFTFKTLLHAR